MKKKTSRSEAAFTVAALLFSLLLGLLLGFASWQAHSLSLRVTESRASLADCQQLVARIEAARKAPETASSTQQTEEELSRRIEQWARTAKISPHQMIRIDPLSPRRVGDSDYLVQGADVELEGLTLPQLASLAAAVKKEDSRLRVSRLRISAPRSPGDSSEASSSKIAPTEVWRCELALTYLLHSPKSDRR